MSVAMATPMGIEGASARASEVIKALNHGIRRSVLRFLSENGAASSTQIRHAIPGVVANQLNFHVDLLVASGVVTKEKRFGYRGNFVAPTTAIQAPWVQAVLQLTAAEDK